MRACWWSIVGLLLVGMSERSDCVVVVCLSVGRLVVWLFVCCIRLPCCRMDGWLVVCLSECHVYVWCVPTVGWLVGWFWVCYVAVLVCLVVCVLVS